MITSQVVEPRSNQNRKNLIEPIARRFSHLVVILMTEEADVRGVGIQIPSEWLYHDV